MKNLSYISDFCDDDRHNKMRREMYTILLEYLDIEPELKSMRMRLCSLQREGYNVKHLLNVICYQKWLEKYSIDK